MKHIKKMLYDENASLYVDKSDRVLPALAMLAALLIGGGCFAIGFFADASFLEQLAWLIAAGVMTLAALAALIRLVYDIRFPFLVVLDDEHLFIRKGAGYLKFHKFDIGLVEYQSGSVQSSAEGHGVERFVVERSRITFRNAIKPIRQRVRNGEKLAYVLLAVVQNPHFGTDWSIAYESLPQGKRAPGSF